MTVDKTQVIIEDDGVGVGEPERRSGLLNMAQRAKILHGTFVLENTPNNGTRLVWCVPTGDVQ